MQQRLVVKFHHFITFAGQISKRFYIHNPYVAAAKRVSDECNARSTYAQHFSYVLLCEVQVVASYQIARPDALPSGRLVPEAS